jgi:hypothetical protein
MVCHRRSGTPGGSRTTLGLEVAQALLNSAAERVEHDADRTEHQMDLCGVIEDRLRVNPQAGHPSAGPDQARRNDHAGQVAVEFKQRHRTLWRSRRYQKGQPR